ncbi:fumarylacetoacetate hydrolase family protein [bacterium]|nr:fumarylacetoacetate hydrolase family protein [bacterium]
MSRRFVRLKNCEFGDWGELSEDGLVTQILGDLCGTYERKDEIGLLSDLETESLSFGANVFGLAFNYKDLVGIDKVKQEPLVFNKGRFSTTSSSADIVILNWMEKVWVEVELAIIIGRPIFRASQEEAKASILGYTIANDITTSNLYGRDHHLLRSKSGPGLCPIGQVLIRDLDTSALKMTTSINGTLTQESNTRNRILNDVDSISLISQYVPLGEGDVIITGTPFGALNSLVHPGDVVHMEIEGIGFIHQNVVEE